MKLKENYIGSITIIAIGCLYFALDIYGTKLEHILFGTITGPGISLAAIAYILAKRRRLYVATPTTLNIGIEATSILLSVFLLVEYSAGYLMFFTEQPPTSIIWIGSIAAYIFMAFGSRDNDVITYKKPNENKKNKESKLRASVAKFYGSSVAVAFGSLYFISAISAIAKNTGGSANGLFLGPAIILGALAYKSAKKRKLNIVATTVIREIFEIVAILLILASVLMLNVDIKKFMAETPVSFLIWLWALIPYFITAFSIRKNKGESAKVTSKEVDKSIEKSVLDTTSKPSLDKPRVAGPLEGLGGWLILVGLNVVFTPLRQLIEFNQSYDVYIENLTQFFSSDRMVLMFSGENPDALYLFLVILFEFSVGLIFLFLFIYLAYLFFSKKVTFPSFFIKIHIGFLVWLIIDTYVVSLLPVAAGGGVIDKEYWTQIAGRTFFMFVWVMYMLKSVRVKATFVN